MHIKKKLRKLLLLVTLTMSLLFAQVKECFNNFDNNGDGYISMMEFVEVTAFERKTTRKTLP